MISNFDSVFVLNGVGYLSVSLSLSTCLPCLAVCAWPASSWHQRDLVAVAL